MTDSKQLQASFHEAAPLGGEGSQIADSALSTAAPSAYTPEETPAEEALRSLACWLGAGGYNAPTVDAKAFEEKIRWGVENACKEAVLMASRDAARYQWLQVRGAAFDGDPKRYLEQGLVYRFGNLDAAIDREMAVAQLAGRQSASGSPARQGAEPDGRDAARYRWLTAHAFVGECFTDEGVVLEVHNTDRRVPIAGSVDSAIDAAMAAASSGDTKEKSNG